MAESSINTGPRLLEPLPYQTAIRDYLKREEPEVWEWFASHKVRDDQAESVHFELLKSTYRVDRETQPGIYATAEEVAVELGLDVPVTIYQAQNPQGVNASLAYLPNEAHIVLHGPVVSKLTGNELRALWAHELSHLLLWQGWDGEFLIVDQILAAMTHDAGAQVAHFASARLFDLYGEIFCDRGSLSVVGDPLVVVAMLVKVQTEVEEVSAESYARQAEEIFNEDLSKNPVSTEKSGSRTSPKASPHANHLTHPEAFIRARAIRLWSDQDAEAETKIEQMIEGSPALEELDLLAQEKVSRRTRRLVDAILAPKWMQTDLALAHARLFYEGYVPPNKTTNDAHLQKDIDTTDKLLCDYYCYVLLDFVTVDRDLEEYPLAAALAICERLGTKSRFCEIARQELRLRKRQIEKIDQEKEKLLAKAKQRTIVP